jgi:hypothetical protein
VKRKDSFISILAGSITLLSLLLRGKVKGMSEKANPEIKDVASESIKEPTPPVVLIEQTKEIKDNSLAARQGQEQTKLAQMSYLSDKRLQTIFAGAVAAFTIILATVSIFQWRTMEKSLRVTERAYLVVSDVRIDFGAASIKASIENIGRVPADNVEVGVNISRGAKGRVEDSLYDMYHSAVQVFPGKINPQFTQPLNNFTPEEAELIRMGKEKLSMIVTVFYDDGFGNSVESDFYFEYNPPPDEGWTLTLLHAGHIDWKQKVEEYRRRHPNQ